MLLTISMSKNV